MEVILLESVSNLGSFGDTVKVKAGYARNYLVPQKKALPATSANTQYFEEKRQEFQAQLQQKQSEARNRADLLTGCTLNLEMNAHDDGKLYGSVGIREITSLLTEQGIKILKSEVQLPDGPFRQIGDHQVRIQITPEISVDVALNITANQNNQPQSDSVEMTNG